MTRRLQAGHLSHTRQLISTPPLLTEMFRRKSFHCLQIALLLSNSLSVTSWGGGGGPDLVILYSNNINQSICMTQLLEYPIGVVLEVVVQPENTIICISAVR